MKIEINITDANAADLAKIAAALNGDSVVTQVNKGVSEGLKAIPAPVATNTDESDDDSDTTVNENAPATDKNGVPWDARIHSASKAINANGSWRRVRGISDEEFNRIEAELKARNISTPVADNAAPQPVEQAAPAPIPAPPANLTMEAAAAAGNQEIPAAAPQPVQPSATQPAPTMTQPAPAVEYTYGTLMQAVMTAMQAQTITNEDVMGACASVGVGSITELQADGAKLGQFVSIMRAAGKLA